MTPNPTIDPDEGGDNVPAQLLAAVNHLDETVARLATRLRWVVVGGVLTLAVAVFAVVMFVQLNDTQNKLEVTVSQVTETRTDVLCPLYGVFLASYDPDSPQAQNNPQQYEASFDVIREGAVILGCQITPPVGGG